MQLFILIKFHTFLDGSEDLDGMDLSAMFTDGAASTRDEYVYNIDLEPMPYFGQAAIR